MSFRSLFTTDDYWAVWIGLGLLFFTLIIFSFDLPKGWDQLKEYDKIINKKSEAPFNTIEWWKAYDLQQKVKSSNTKTGKWLKNLTAKPAKWEMNPFNAFYSGESNKLKLQEQKQIFELRVEVEKKLAEAEKFEKEARIKGYANSNLNIKAKLAIDLWRNSIGTLKKAQKKANQKTYNKLPSLFFLFTIFALLFGLGNLLIGIPFQKFFLAFIPVFLLAVISYTIGSQVNIKAYGLGYAFWAILIGLIISNTIGTSGWIFPALSTEFYIKTGLVLLGAEILLGKVATIGLPGIFVAWVVTPLVLVTTYWFGQKILKIGSKTLNITISADMSVCGVSAAVATAAACKAKKEELTLAIGLSMIFTSIMMIAMPILIQVLGMPEVLGGAWLGGTIDATGAVVAAGAFLGNKALSVAATIKMIQNMLIGLVAFGVAVYFAKRENNLNGKKPTIGLGEIWNRFPKFILGFLFASLTFSILYEVLGTSKGYAFIDQGVISTFSKNLRGWFFCLAFVSIGLSTNFKELSGYLKGGKPLILYFSGQLLNILLTLLMAYTMFYLIFPEITEKI